MTHRTYMVCQQQQKLGDGRLSVDQTKVKIVNTHAVDTC